MIYVIEQLMDFQHMCDATQFLTYIIAHTSRQSQKLEHNQCIYAQISPFVLYQYYETFENKYLVNCPVSYPKPAEYVCIHVFIIDNWYLAEVVGAYII